MEVFSHLSKEEIEKLSDALALVTILIGAADGNLDSEERTWSEQMLRARSYSGLKALQEFYRNVSEGFWVNLQHEMAELPKDIAERNAVISTRLEALNDILSKLTPQIAYAYYKGLLRLAAETAKSSGGFLRIAAISPEEKKWLELPMITPISKPPGMEDLEDVNDDEEAETEE